eukprot:Gb_17835 [translate_table: standard]
MCHVQKIHSNTSTRDSAANGIIYASRFLNQREAKEFATMFSLVSTLIGIRSWSL